MEPTAHLGITPIEVDSWHPGAPENANWQQALEAGQVLYCPHLPLPFEARDARYLDAAYADPKRKSIYIRADRAGLFGTEVSGIEHEELLSLLKRFEAASMGLLADLFPGYVGKMRAAGTSFRPRPTGEGAAALSWRKDDTRLHVDAFPSNPTHGMRILRVFSNVGTAPRVWRVGEPFEQMARHFLPQIPRPRPRIARLSKVLGITKRVRSAYDHYMLYLHDLAKADLAYQRASLQVSFPFPPGSAWICFSDQVMHAAMSGQFMMEQTVHLPIPALAYPERSPLAILERLTQRALL
jgi:3-deoxy-D-manno-oct-2-ulosonic acid (Kdo) hydroxylase